VVFLLPFILTLVLWVGSILERQEIKRISNYIRELEQKVLCEHNGYGWETSLAKDRESIKKSKHLQHERWEDGLWLFLCAGNLALCIAVVHGK
jgi:hypothetical protein